MSHEIRTPLNAVLGFARIGLGESTGVPAGEHFNRIVKAGEHLLGVINDILDVSKIEAGKLQIEQVSFALVDTVNDVAGLFAVRAAEKGLVLSVELASDLPQWVSSDRIRLSQILSNLLSNAIKFTPVGEVCLQVTNESALTCFHVTDTGMGMSDEQLSRLFNRFEQADSSVTRKFGGSGLGLAISQDLSRLMGGDVRAESQSGAGSRFTLRLPLPAVAAPESTNDLPEASGLVLHGLSVLVVDDVEVNRLLLEYILEQAGIQVAFAENGQQALDCVEQAGATAFDLVLMDVQMPVMDGFEATRRLAAIAPALPVVGVTAHALTDERRLCLAAGMVAVVTKPVETEILLETIRQRVAPGKLTTASAVPDIGEKRHPVPPAPTSALPLPDAGAINWPRLLQRYDGKRPFLQKIAAAAKASHADTPDQLRRAAAAGDRETLAFAAHKLKGLAGNLLAAQLGDSALTLGDCLRAGSDDFQGHGETLAQALETVLRELDWFDQAG
jgi:CheY-like chemotaxis protein